MQRSVPQKGAVGPCMSALKRGVSWQPWGIPPSPAYTREMEGGGSNLAVSCHGCHLAGSRIA